MPWTNPDLKVDQLREAMELLDRVWDLLDPWADEVAEIDEGLADIAGTVMVLAELVERFDRAAGLPETVRVVRSKD